jgi:hypothetical protein
MEMRGELLSPVNAVSTNDNLRDGEELHARVMVED